jgi:hypothetical protein
MHVQLVNDGDNKQNKLKIQSLCFYYRNHKHVLYGSFTINDEVFIFSFNIFDIYRSYQSRSNKKSSKSHKTSSKDKTSSKAVLTNTTTTTTINESILKQQQQQQLQLQEFKQQDSLDATTIKALESQLSEETQDEQQKQSADSAPESLLPPPPLQNKTEQIQKPIFLKQNSNSWTLPTTTATPSSLNSTVTTSTTSNNFNNLLFNAFNSLSSNTGDNSLLFTQALQQQTAAAAALNNCNLCPKGGFSFTTNSNLQQQPAAFNPNLQKRQTQISNLSNFLIVKFEIGANNESTSKSKGKYKKSIKISVSAKVLPNVNDSNDTSTTNDTLTIPLTQKAFEFTEKCLSFRLACIDLATDLQRQNFNVKLINLYDKSLFSIVNFTIKDANDKESFGYKLYQIKHEENPSIQIGGVKTTTTTATIPVAQQQSNEIQIIATQQQPQIQSVLSATSSSRLNLTELNITSMNIDCNIVSLIAISVTTYEDDPDIRLIAMLDHNGLISIVDPFELSKMCEFSSPSSDEKFVTMTYCYGMFFFCIS